MDGSDGLCLSLVPLCGVIIRFVLASVKEGMKETPDARKKIGRSPVLQPELVRYSPQTLGRDSPSVPHAIR